MWGGLNAFPFNAMNGKILSDIAVIVIRNEQYEHE
jgi:hypothetical protein